MPTSSEDRIQYKAEMATGQRGRKMARNEEIKSADKELKVMVYGRWTS
jgi:hypothetical protein